MLATGGTSLRSRGGGGELPRGGSSASRGGGGMPNGNNSRGSGLQYVRRGGGMAKAVTKERAKGIAKAPPSLRF